LAHPAGFVRWQHPIRHRLTALSRLPEVAFIPDCEHRRLIRNGLQSGYSGKRGRGVRQDAVGHFTEDGEKRETPAGQNHIAFQGRVNHPG